LLKDSYKQISKNNLEGFILVWNPYWVKIVITTNVYVSNNYNIQLKFFNEFK
jgi:hypothetical protein